ncbi:holo-ACP synthase [Paenibacillus thalictri]|uniref:Holo-[acyl-carrier-protein] synthase n=1 Tax=Paenibacillus thalictri TaxID=2527873 RepID=A0A4Q9DG59_9BACL|nr:holo-ACP synthase [Paenibacillus thalictri]TBL71180.1 holo-[acyl-carrier-protein] synthase [Paenibacillus thalictri]
MIYGIGTDVLEIERIRSILSQPAADRFVERVLTGAERELANARKGRLPEFIAGRFAAKEAVVKALGCGIGKQVGFHDLTIMPDRLGKPCCLLSEGALTRLGLNGRPLTIHLSISHSASTAIAYCVIEA